MRLALVIPASNQKQDRFARALLERSHTIVILAVASEGSDERAADRAFDGVRILRFRVDKRDERRSARIESRIATAGSSGTVAAATLTEVEIDVLVRNRLNSTELLTYLARHIESFDAIVFFDDRSGITLRGWRIAMDRTAIVVDSERNADTYLLPENAMMLGAGRVIFETEDREAASRETYGPGSAARARVVGRLDGTDETSFDRLEAVLTEFAAPRARSERGEALSIIHRLERAEFAESLTLLALQYDGLLNAAGYPSEIMADDRDYRLGSLIREPSGSDSSDIRQIAYASSLGLATSVVVGEGFPILETADGRRVSIPGCVNTEAWSVEPARDVLAPLLDGSTNLLSVGDVVPENRILELIEVFRNYVPMDFNSRLLIVGPMPDEAYARRIERYVVRCGLESRIRVTGAVSQQALAAFYRTASIFVSLRDRYLTGLSLLEAMAFDVPVCVRDAAAARAITGRRAILFASLTAPFDVAALWRVMTSDRSLRDSVVVAQRNYVTTLTPDRTRRALMDALGLINEPIRA